MAHPPKSSSFCYKCGAALPSDANFCPDCGTERFAPVATERLSPAAVEPVAPPKRGIKKRWKILGGVLVVFLILLAFGSRYESPSRRSANVVGSAPTTTPRPTSQPKPTARPASGTSENPAPFTARLSGGGATVQLSNGRFANEFDFSKPKGGYKYLIIDTRIEGTGPDDHAYGPSNFSGEDARTGAGYDSAFVFGNNTLGSDTLSPGEYVTGTIAIEVQDSAERVIVKYDPKPFDDNDLYWIFE